MHSSCAWNVQLCVMFDTQINAWFFQSFLFHLFFDKRCLILLKQCLKTLHWVGAFYGAAVYVCLSVNKSCKPFCFDTPLALLPPILMQNSRQSNQCNCIILMFCGARLVMAIFDKYKLKDFFIGNTIACHDFFFVVMTCWLYVLLHFTRFAKPRKNEIDTSFVDTWKNNMHVHVKNAMYLCG